MKAISLWQPWASAIALKHKRIETRGWLPPDSVQGVRIAIHAAKCWSKHQREFAAVERAVGRLPAQIPLGCIVATAVIADVVGVEYLRDTVGPVERLYGNYEPGRWGWVLKDVIALPEPIPFAGKQGFFNVPDQLLASASHIDTSAHNYIGASQQ
jgi:hypothetical protein